MYCSPDCDDTYTLQTLEYSEKHMVHHQAITHAYLLSAYVGTGSLLRVLASFPQ